MASLEEVLNDPARKDSVVQDCMGIIDAEVSDKGGLSGLAIKGGYKAVQGVKPGFVQKVVRDLLPEFATAIDPVYQEAVEAGGSIERHLVAQKSRVADALLGITDAKAERSTNKLVRKTYEKLRGTAKKNVEAAVPRLGGLIEKHHGG